MSNSSTFEGFEIFYNGLLMSLKMVQRLFAWTVYLYVLGGLVCSYLYVGHLATRAIFVFYTAKIINAAQLTNKTIYLNWVNYDGTVAKTSATYIANNKEIADFVTLNLFKVLFVFECSLVIFLLLPIGLFFFKNKAVEQSKKKYIKGSKFLTEDSFIKRLKKNKDQTFLPFGSFVKTTIFGKVEEGSENDKPYQLKMPIKCETKHTSVIGRPGSGKTVFMSGLIAELKSTENYKGLTYCYKGDYVGKFYNPEKDLLFNPLDKRSMNWALFNEIKTRMDIEMVVGSLIPVSASGNDKDTFFKVGAKNVLVGIFLYLFNNDLTTNKDIWEHVSKKDEDIVKLLQITPGGEKALKSIGTPGSGQASGVFGVFMQHTSCFEYMQDMKGDFNIQNWLENGTGVIYLSNYENMKEILKPILSLFIDLLGRRLLSMPDDRDRSIYFNLDELHTLQKLGSIVEILTLARSKGGKVFIGTQSYSQLDEIYGEKVRHSMINSCGNSVIMALAGEKEQKIASDKISEVQFFENNKTSSMGVSDFRDGMSIATQRKKEPLVMPADIKLLPELACFVEFSNYNGIIRSVLTWTNYEDVNKSFDMRSDLILERQENLTHPPKKSSKHSDTRFTSLAEEVEHIDYDEIAAQVNHDEINDYMEPN